MQRSWQTYDAERRNAISVALITSILPFAYAWIGLAVLLRIPGLMFTASLSTAGLLLGLMLLRRRKDTLARIVVLTVENLAFVLAALVCGPESEVKFLLIVTVGVPFIIMSWSYQRLLVVIFAIMPTVAWLALTLLEPRLGLPGTPTIDVARNFLAPATGVTVFAVIAVQFAFFDRIVTGAAQELRETLKDLHKANTAKDAFLSSMNHELRSPLNIVMGVAQLLEDDEETRPKALHIQTAARSILAMVEKGIKFSRDSVAKAKLSPEVIDLDQLVKDSLAEVEHLTKGQPNRFHFKFGPNRFILADRIMVLHALVQVLENAWLYSKPDTPIDLSLTENQPGKLRLSITNQSRVPTPRDMADAFVPFERLTMKNGSTFGLGIGLTIAKQMAERTGVTIEIDTPRTDVVRVTFEMPAQGGPV